MGNLVRYLRLCSRLTTDCLVFETEFTSSHHVRTSLRDAQKKLSEETVTSFQQDEYFFDLVNDSVMTRTMDGIINFWNHSAEKLYGWRKEEAIGRVSHNLLQTQFPKPLEEIESELVRNGRWEGKLVHTTRDGRPRGGRKPVDFGAQETVRSGS